MVATKMVFQIWKTSGLEDLQMTSRKSSDGAFSYVFNQMVLIFHLDISGFDIHVFQIWIRLWMTYGKSSRKSSKIYALEDFLEVFQTTSKKSSRRLLRSLLMGSSSMSSGV
ncbi:hypothetical protein DY000_02046144 [Brassica cretica]|uniref:Uncharacterized protein n=1 Tax=Brassica cretica TaxID=69181 RepID=A0ABQ7EMK7_BRACR|nr:hypothetical protein DY000_02046144 [Brassica cretica]